MKTSDNGINLIIEFEGCKLTSYKDIVGIWTIGYGHTGPEVAENQTLPHPNDAIELLKKDLVKFESYVNSLVTFVLNQNQFDALVSFVYNLGPGNLKKSNLLKLLNANDPEKASKEILKFDFAGGHKVAGLTRRRTAEYNLFIKGV